MIHEEDLQKIRRKRGLTNRIINYGYSSQWPSLVRFFFRLFFHNEIPIHVARMNPRLIHPFCVVVHDKAIIGEDCTLFHCVTIGGTSIGNRNGAPTIGKGAILFPHSMIIGNIKIGDNVIIGAGSIVINDVPSNVIVAGNPARIVGTICAK